MENSQKEKWFMLQQLKANNPSGWDRRADEGGEGSDGVMEWKKNKLQTKQEFNRYGSKALQ